jgi:hypothetical protein
MSPPIGPLAPQDNISRPEAIRRLIDMALGGKGLRKQ